MSDKWTWTDLSGCDAKGDSYSAFHIGIEGGEILAELRGRWEDRDEIERRCRLMASAPAMLEALKDVRKWVDIMDMPPMTWALVNEAIAEAEGLVNVSPRAKMPIRTHRIGADEEESE